MDSKVHLPAPQPDIRHAESAAARLEYRALLARMRDIVLDTVPAGANVLAISRGDAQMLDLGPRVTHFPQNELGQYAGYHPADSAAAITHLESLRSRGAEYLLIPATAFWWLQHYKHFRRALEGRYPVVARDATTCIIFALDARAATDGQVPGDEQERRYRATVRQCREVVEALLPPGAAVAVVSGGDDALLELGARRGWHFPQDERNGYAGHHPADSAAAVDQLERLRRRGAEYLVIPQTAFWWLSSYPGFADHVTTRCRLVTYQSAVCRVYALAAPVTPGDV